MVYVSYTRSRAVRSGLPEGVVLLPEPDPSFVVNSSGSLPILQYEPHDEADSGVLRPEARSDRHQHDEIAAHLLLRVDPNELLPQTVRQVWICLPPKILGSLAIEILPHLDELHACEEQEHGEYSKIRF